MTTGFKIKKNLYMLASEDLKVFCFGMTERPLEERHKDGDWAKFHNYLKARGEKLIVIGWWEGVSVLDTWVHDWLKKQPTIQKFAEWFSHKVDLYILANRIEKEFFPETPKSKKDLTLKKHQQKFLNKVLSSWEEWKEFLLFAKCRAGKSIMVLSAIARKGVKVSLIVSRYTSPIQSWKEDSKNFSTFNNIVFINLADKDYLEQIDYWYNTDKQLVLWTTIQGNNRWNKIPCDVDLIVYDEAHQGYNSTQFKKLRKKFDCQVLYVTGTAFSMVWDFSESNSYTYSYFEEQLDKKLGLNNAPSMRVILKKYETEEYKKLYGDDPDAMKNLFSIEKGETDFVQPSLVQDFYSETFGDQKHLKPKDRLLNGKFHIFMTLPSVAACHASVKYLEKTKFAPLVVTGDTKEDSDTIRKHVAENEYTIILTVSANVLGVTIPEIDTVINASEGESINFWTQFAFRGGSSDRDWDVIDFCPQRCLKTLREIFIAACENNPMIAEYIMLDFIPIIEWSNGFVIMTQEQVASILASDVTNTISLISNIVNSMDMDKLANCQFNLSLLSKEKNNGSKREVNDNGANGKGNIQRDGESSEKQDNSLVLTKKETILAILERVPLTIYHCIKSGIIPNSVHSLINTDHYVYNTLDAEKIIETLIFDEVIDAKSFSYRINQAVIDIQNSISIDECKTLEKLSCSRQSQQSMPVELIDDLFGDLF
jgi:superfamily II DNA or RNA helicase